MLRYEVIFLTVPEITADEKSGLEKRLEAVVSEHKGTVLSFDRWGKYKLAYPVRDRDYGVYFLARFEVENGKNGALLEAIKNFFAVRNEDIVARHMIAVLDPKKSLEYARPESLEEVPAKDVETFLKENKMSGLLKNSPKDRSSESSLAEMVQE